MFHLKRKNLWLRCCLWTLFYLVLCYLQPKQLCSWGDRLGYQVAQRSYRSHQLLQVSVRPGHVLTSCERICTSDGRCGPTVFKLRRLRWLESFCGEERVALANLGLRFREAKSLTLYCSQEARSMQSLAKSPIWVDVHASALRNQTNNDQSPRRSFGVPPNYAVLTSSTKASSPATQWNLLIYYNPEALSKDFSGYVITRSEWLTPLVPKKLAKNLHLAKNYVKEAFNLSVMFIPDVPDRNPDTFLAKADSEKQTVHLWPASKTRLTQNEPKNLLGIPIFKSKGELFSFWVLVLGLIFLIESYRCSDVQQECFHLPNGYDHKLTSSRHYSGAAASHKRHSATTNPDCEIGVTGHLPQSDSAFQTVSVTTNNATLIDASNGTTSTKRNVYHNRTNGDCSSVPCAKDPTKASSLMFFAIFCITQNVAMALLSFTGIFRPPTSCVKLVAADVATAVVTAFFAAIYTEYHDSAREATLSAEFDKIIDGRANDVAEPCFSQNRAAQMLAPWGGCYAAEAEVLLQSAPSSSRKNSVPCTQKEDTTSNDEKRSRLGPRLPRGLLQLAPHKLFATISFEPWESRISALLSGFPHRKLSRFLCFRELRLQSGWLQRATLLYIVPRLILTIVLWGQESSRLHAMLLNLQILFPIVFSALVGAKLGRMLSQYLSWSRTQRIFRSSNLSISYPLCLLQFWLVLDLLRIGWLYPAAGRPLPFTLFFRLPRPCSGDLLDSLPPEKLGPLVSSPVAYCLLRWHGWNALCILFVSLVLLVEC
ncbi:hypothetical protein CCYA_CCYA09G2679 [Cyanidiococcus yangmingshanensis]|nr:hypothetical protein CCYA_CCYA09G2679 [Cyanidiococcus yangmingshanensis]